MSEQSNNTKMICEKLDRISNNLDRISNNLEDTNKILSSFLLQATSESKFIKMTPKEIKKDIPKYVDLLDKVRDSAGLNHE
tara:strand:+ start:1700 stop:1942 length:243 start_codon:yes stop_codon:yes gene_type:complete